MAEPKALDFDGYSMWDGQIIGRREWCSDFNYPNRKVDIERFLVRAVNDGEYKLKLVKGMTNLNQDYSDILAVMFGIAYAEWDASKDTLFMCPDAPVDIPEQHHTKITLSRYDDDFIKSINTRLICNVIDTFLQNICYMLNQGCSDYSYRMRGFEDVVWSGDFRGLYDPLTRLMQTSYTSGPLFDTKKAYSLPVIM